MGRPEFYYAILLTAKMKNNYKISRMSKEEVSIAIDWMRLEGWNPGLNDVKCFYAADNHGFFAGKLDEQIIAVASAIVYDERFAFCGCYIVKPEYRHQGYGIQLTKARLNYVGDRITGLDGVLEMVKEYEKIGYKPMYNNIRYALNRPVQVAPNANIKPIGPNILMKVMAYDRNYFPAVRTDFLNCWLQPDSGKALVYLSNDEIYGYTVIHKCFTGYKIGPLFAESAEIAEALFLQAINGLEERPIFLDIPKPNTNASKLVKKYEMEKVFETIRMYRCGAPDINLHNVYGITTFELG